MTSPLPFDTFTLRLPYVRPPLSLNGRYHWARKASIEQEIRNTVIWLARRNKVPHLRSAHITLHWVPKDRRRRDTDNPYPTVKACIDGLVKAGVLTDDSSGFVTSSVTIEPVNKADPHLYLTIEPF